jgi:hypothetical protein
LSRDDGDFFDRALGEPCRLTDQLGATGGYCVPGSVSAYFADTACSTPIGLIPQGQTTQYLFVLLADGSHRELHKKGSVYTGEVHVRSGAMCISTTVTSGTLYDVGDLVDPSSLVRFDTTQIQVPNGVDVSAWTGSDGSRTITGLYEHNSGRPCAITKSAVDQTYRCWRQFPCSSFTGNSDRHFSDASCTTPAGRSTCDTPPVPYSETSLDPQDACKTNVVYRYYNPGALLSTLYALDASNTCTAQQFTMGKPWYWRERGAELAPGDYPLIETVERGDRLRVTFLSLGGFTMATSDGKRFHDAGLNMTCSPTKATDGKLHCLPTTTAALGYSDSSCTTVASVWNVPSCAEQSWVVDPSGTSIMKIGNKLAESSAYAVSNGQCMAVVADHWAIDQRVAVSDLPEIILSIE